MPGFIHPVAFADRGCGDETFAEALREFGERVSNRKAAQITAEDVMGTAAAMLSVFIREPEFQRQTKDKLATVEATLIVETMDRLSNLILTVEGDGTSGPARR